MFILPTIDVEAAHGSSPFEQMILGEVGDNATWGVYRQAEVFQRYGISATFFVDVYEHTLWGESNLERLCHTLAEMGQDVQLHTHPSWRDDPRDFDWLRKYKKEKSYLPPKLDFMAKLSYGEQVAVLQHGVELFEKWLGKKPIAHRSGGYSINEDTVRAIKAVGIPCDSSMNASHANSKISWSFNRVIEREGLIEIPVTLLRYVVRMPGAAKTYLYAKLKKTDLDHCSTQDLLAYVDKGSALGVRVMTLFMHSYSLLSMNPQFTRLKPSPRKLNRLETFLGASAKMPGVEFLSCTQLVERYLSNPAFCSGSDEVPDVRSWGTVLGLAANKINQQFAKVMRIA